MCYLFISMQRRGSTVLWTKSSMPSVSLLIFATTFVVLYVEQMATESSRASSVISLRKATEERAAAEFFNEGEGVSFDSAMQAARRSGDAVTKRQMVLLKKWIKARRDSKETLDALRKYIDPLDHW